ncbi:hypothetical protein [Nocardioides sp. Leaf307]|uniref:hypothetical protein n=1 Tax=Nocardioides sp. Leaf307 TaxID=1736331 RepID=UPI0012E9BA09|nr:hypothetical protein [Nocardioides sp. Leaf307]
MKLCIIETTLEQREAAKKAATKRYEHNRHTPDRAGWQGGKCPVGEYRAIIAEIGAANALGYDWNDLCLFSTDPADYTTADLGGIWEVKAGSTFSKKDITKGAKYIIWVAPWNTGQVFDCGYDTCKTLNPHRTLSGVVEVLGWTNLEEDLSLCSDFGNYYKPAGAAMRSAATLPTLGGVTV